MFKSNIKILIFIISLIISSSAGSQSLDGLKEIVSSHQDKIVTIEDNLKKLTGTIEKQSNNKVGSQVDSVIQINAFNDTIKILQSKINNITNLVYNLEFSLKRIERHLELSSINNTDKKQLKNGNLGNKLSYKQSDQIKLNKKSLDGQTKGVLGFIKEDEKKLNDLSAQSNNVTGDKRFSILPMGSEDEHYNFAQDAALKGDFIKAEKAFKEFLDVHKKSKKQADAHYWLGRVYYTQKKYEEAAITLAEFNSIFPNDSRFQETTLLIAESAVNFAPKTQLCEILSQSLEFMMNPSEKFKKRINSLKKEKLCSAE